MARLDRREFLCLGAAGVLAGCRSRADSAPLVRFGMVADLHYADIDTVGSRFYRDARRRLREAVDAFNAHGLDFAIELGDFKDDAGGRDRTIACLDEIEAEFARFNGPRYHVAGNHDFDCLTPGEFLSRTPNAGTVRKTGHYSFEHGGVKFVVLDACYDSSMRHYDRCNPWTDSNMPPEELAWFERELASADGHVVVFCHQRLDESAEPRHLVRNAAAVRRLVEASGKVRAVLTGHQHWGGACVVNGIPYYTLKALVVGVDAGANSFAEVAVHPSGAISVIGCGNADSFVPACRRQSI